MKNLKKVISSVAAVAMVASSASAFAVTFPDVDSSASYAGAVTTLTALGVIEGDDAGKFNPDNKVTRAEFAKMVVEARGEGSSAQATSTTKFTDSTNHWAAGYITQGVSDGFIDGYDDTTFGPDDQVTYEQAVKMLVAAIGYTTYAEEKGGYPTGYMTYGSSLKIINGVSGEVSSDTQLTRAQCAILINNAMQAPIVEIDGYDTDAWGNRVPKEEIRDGEGKDWKTLLTTQHDAYVVKGRVTATSKSGDVDNDEVRFRIESADNFDDMFVGTKSTAEDPFDQTMNIGDTDAASMEFVYAEAIVQQDEDTDEWTILSITQYGSNDEVGYDTNDFSKDDTVTIDGTDDLSADNIDKLAFEKSATSSSTVKYSLQKETSDKERYAVYVNGVEVTATDWVTNYLENNYVGKVRLIDATETASTSTDGKYDYVIIDYYSEAMVDSVQTKSDGTVKVNLTNKVSTDNLRSLEWDPTDSDDKDVTFTLDGTVISYADLQADDVLMIKYDVTGDASDSDYYDVTVSRSTVSGAIKSKSTANGSINIDGTSYDLANEDTLSEYEVGTDYTVYLDATGYVVYYEEGISSKTYGVIVSMYTASGNTKKSVKLVTADGSVVSYQVKSTSDESSFEAVVKDAGYTDNGNTWSVSDYSKAVVEYQISGGEIKYKGHETAVNSKNPLEFKENTGKLGSYSISETATAVIDISDYANDETASKMSLTDFEDESEYTAYVYAKNDNTGDYRFILVTDGTTSVKPDTTLAVVKEVVGDSTYNDEDVVEATVVRNGETATVYFEDGTTLTEGDVIVYKVSSDGYVEEDDLTKFVDMNNYSSYDDMLTKVSGNFAGLISNGNTLANSEDDGSRTLETLSNGSWKQSSSKDVYGYFGVMYRNTNSGLEIFPREDTAHDGYSTVDDLQSFSSNGANVVTYDFGSKADKGIRVDASSVPSQSKGVFTNICWYDLESDDSTTLVQDKNGSYLNWDSVISEDCSPSIVFVRTVDNDTTDIVVYIAD